MDIDTLNIGLEAFNTIDSLKTFGFIFENLCIRDLSAYTSKFGASISYYSDSSDIEVDCVVHLNDGYALIECKVGKTKLMKELKIY